MRKPAADRDDYDSPWKDLLDRWQRPFLEFFFPRIAADIDWSRGFEFLDKELQKVTRRGHLRVLTYSLSEQRKDKGWIYYPSSNQTHAPPIKEWSGTELNRLRRGVSSYCVLGGLRRYDGILGCC